MKVAITQPYFFPYLGYYKLINSVDKFIFLDDVQYVRRGWINRNFIKMQDPLWITVPIKHAHQKTPINNIMIDSSWATKVDVHKKTFEMIYGKRCKKSVFYNYYDSLKSYSNLNELLCDSVRWTCSMLNIEVEFLNSSAFPSKKKSQDRIIEICKEVGAKEYFNLPRGINLYDRKIFSNNSVDLNFINTDDCEKVSVIESFFLKAN